MLMRRRSRTFHWLRASLDTIEGIWHRGADSIARPGSDRGLLEVALRDRIEIAMMDELREGGGTLVVAPNVFIISLHPDDLLNIANILMGLVSALEAHVVTAVQENKYWLPGPPQVQFRRDDHLVKGAIHVVAVRHDGFYSDEDRRRAQQVEIYRAITELLSIPPQMLELVRGNKAVPLHIIRGRRTTIGRDIDNDVVLLADSISRHHARIEFAEGAYRVVDLHSRNGTWVNGRNVEDAPGGEEPGVAVLMSGDEIAFGPHILYRFLPYPGSESLTADSQQEPDDARI